MDPSDEFGEAYLPGLRIDDTLEDRLKAHGISKRNIRSIIHEVFSDTNVQKLLKSTDDPDLDFTGIPTTRSKKPKVTGDDFVCDFTQQNEWFQDPQYFDVDCAKENDIDLKHTGIEESLGAFSDTCNTSANAFDWQRWLADFTDNGSECSEKANEDDSDSDPDFNFLAELEDPDEEDYRNDCATRITKKELKSLRCEKGVAVPGYSIAKTKITSTPDNAKRQSGTTRIESNLNDQKGMGERNAVTAFQRAKTLREKLILLRNEPSLKRLHKKHPVPTKHAKPVDKISPHFNKVQLNTLKQQMQQHIQLLSQTFLLDRRSENANQAFQFMIEFEALKNLVADPEHSFFNVPFMQNAIDLLHRNKPKPASENLHSQDPVYGASKETMLPIVNSKIFMYKELLPDFSRRFGKPKGAFTASEDNLIAHGLEETSECYGSRYDLISMYVMPARTRQEIRTRVKSTMSCRTLSASSNPIVRQKTLGVLPQRCEAVKDVAHRDARCPLSMSGTLPSWVNSLKNAQTSTAHTSGCAVTNTLSIYNVFPMNEHCGIPGTNVTVFTPVRDSEDDGKCTDCVQQPVGVLGNVNKSRINDLRDARNTNGILSANNVKIRKNGTVINVWTKSIDKTILCVCKEHGGPTKKALLKLVTLLPGYTKRQIRTRFHELLSLYHNQNENG